MCVCIAWLQRLFSVQLKQFTVIRKTVIVRGEFYSHCLKCCFCISSHIFQRFMSWGKLDVRNSWYKYQVDFYVCSGCNMFTCLSSPHCSRFCFFPLFAPMSLFSHRNQFSSFLLPVSLFFPPNALDTTISVSKGSNRNGTEHTHSSISLFSVHKLYFSRAKGRLLEHCLATW